MTKKSVAASDRLDRARQTWRLKHRELGLPVPGARKRVEPTGLATRVPEMSMRLVVLPGDPLAVELDFDDEFWAWWHGLQETPFGQRLMWHDRVPSNDAAANVIRVGHDWDTYIAIHRHGGIEIGSSVAFTGPRDIRVFRLRRTIGLVWTGLAAQVAAQQRFPVEGPWEASLALYDTQGSLLVDLGAGWASPFEFGGWDPPPCPDVDVLIRQELDVLPEDPEDIRQLALRFGAMMEDTWGRRERRFLDLKGDLTGDIDLRRWME